MSLLQYFEKKEQVCDIQQNVLSLKYAPKTLSEFMGNYKQIQQIHAWFSQTNKKCLVLTGPIASGKTTLINLFSKAYKKHLHRKHNKQQI